MEAQIESLCSTVLKEIAACADEAQLEAVRVRLLGRGGELTAFSDRMRELSKEEKPRVGKILNESRTALIGCFLVFGARRTNPSVFRRLA